MSRLVIASLLSLATLSSTRHAVASIDPELRVGLESHACAATTSDRAREARAVVTNAIIMAGATVVEGERADVVIALETCVERLHGSILKERLFTFDARIHARVAAPDTGRVFSELSATETALDIAEIAASRAAVEKAGRSIAFAIIRALDGDETRVFEVAIGDLRATRGESATDRARSAIEIRDLSVEDVFPARTPRYAHHALGTVTLENRSPVALGRVRVAAWVRGFSLGPRAMSIDRIGPGERRVVPVQVTIDPERVRVLRESVPSLLEVTVSYDKGSVRETRASTREILVHGAHAIDWTTPDSIAAFVDHRSARVSALATEIHRSAARVPHPLSLPVALFRAMSALSYVPDPENPRRRAVLDDVQYASDTMIRGSGDCEDLAVLYAALAEAVGLPAMLIVTREHVLVAVRAPAPARNARLIAPDPSALFEWADRSWLPIEVTRVGRSFREAWIEGAKVISKESPVAHVVLREAWAEHPPLATDRGGERQPLATLEAEVTKEIEALEAARLGKIDAELAALGGGRESERKRGALLAWAARFDDALSVFSRLAERNDVGGLLGRANIELILGRTEAALSTYRRAIRLQPSLREAHYGVALLATITAREPLLARHAAELALLGAEPALAELREYTGQIDTAGRPEVGASESTVRALVFWR